MATKPRHLKTPTQLWIADNRKRLGLTPGDLARLTGVTEDTARGWESRGKPSQDAMTLLVQRFGVPTPDDGAGSGDGATMPELAALLQRLDRYADLVDALVEQNAQIIARLPTPQDEVDALVDQVVGRAEQRLAEERRSIPSPRRKRAPKRRVEDQQ